MVLASRSSWLADAGYPPQVVGDSAVYLANVIAQPHARMQAPTRTTTVRGITGPKLTTEDYDVLLEGIKRREGARRQTDSSSRNGWREASDNNRQGLRRSARCDNDHFHPSTTHRPKVAPLLCM